MKSLLELKNEWCAAESAYMDALVEAVQNRIKLDKGLESEISFGYEGFSNGVYVSLFGCAGHDKEELTDYIYGLEDTEEFKNTEVIFYVMRLNDKEKGN